MGAPSLCAGWRVQDVVAHMISYEHLSRFGLIRRFIRGRVARTNQVGVDELSALTPAQLVDRLRAHLLPRDIRLVSAA